MKKILLGLSAFTMLFATSCQNDQGFDTTVGETSTVTFAVETPEIATRAYSDGSTATVLQYAVYDANGTELTDLTVTDATINGSTTVNLQLTTGNEYSVIFWAAAPNAPYTVDFAAKTMTVDYTNATSNDEARDAFYKYHTFKVTGAQTETIELRRPFAQLNIGTADYAASTSAGYTPTKSAVTVKNVYSTLNLADGTVNGSAVATFDFANIKKDETFPVEGYEYMAMNYLLVATDKEVVDIEFTYTDANNDAKTRTVGSVPVQRNYRTNIYGNLLTSNVDINVEIKPEYNEPAHELDALHKVALNGGTITLSEDVVLTTPLEIVSNLVIDLNGKTITGAYSKSEGAIIKNNGSLKLVGGTISSTGANGGSAIANYGELVVEGTEINGASIRENGGWPSYPINNYGDMTLTDVTITGYQGAIACGEAGTTILENCTINKEYLNTSSHVFYIYHEDAHVIVNGGTYTHNGMDGSLAYVINGSITVNDGTFSASNGGYGMAPLTNGKVVINGGSFAAMPLNWGGSIILNGGAFKAKPNDAWIAAGYKAVLLNGLYYVLSEVVADAAVTACVTTVTEDTADVAAALANNGEVAMFMWDDVAYIAKAGEIMITSAADEATTSRGVVEYATGLTTATVADGIEVVGNRTFRKCANLETVVFPNTLTEIGPAVFQYCSKLNSVNIPATVTTIGEGAFAECVALTSINIPDGITRLEKDVLRNTGLVSIEIPASVNYIGTFAFRDCESLTEVKILSPEFTIENNSFTNMAAPVPTMTIYVVNAEMKAYLESVLTNYDKSYITVSVM